MEPMQIDKTNMNAKRFTDCQNNFLVLPPKRGRFEVVIDSSAIFSFKLLPADLQKKIFEYLNQPDVLRAAWTLKNKRVIRNPSTFIVHWLNHHPKYFVHSLFFTHDQRQQFIARHGDELIAAQAFEGDSLKQFTSLQNLRVQLDKTKKSVFENIYPESLTRLRNVDLSLSNANYNASAVEFFASRTTSLSKLKLNANEDLSASIHVLLRKQAAWVNLTVLSLGLGVRNQASLFGAALKTSAFPQLESLTLKYISEPFLETFLTSTVMRPLTKLHLHYGDFREDTTQVFFSPLLVNLQKLYLSHLDLGFIYTSSCIQEELSVKFQTTQLKRLFLGNHHVHSNFLEIAHFSSLRTLRLGNYKNDFVKGKGMGESSGILSRLVFQMNMKRLEEIALEKQNQNVNTETVYDYDVFSRSPQAAAVKALSLSGFSFDGILLHRFVEKPDNFVNITKMTITRSSITTSMAIKILQRNKMQLRYLDFSLNVLNNEFVTFVINNVSLRRLRSLNLSHNHLVGREPVAQLRENLTGLEEIWLTGNKIGDEGVVELARWRTLEFTRDLNLYLSDAGNIGLKAIQNSPFNGNIRFLDMTGKTKNNRISRVAAIAFANSRLGKRLVSFKLSYQEIVNGKYKTITHKGSALDLLHNIEMRETKVSK